MARKQGTQCRSRSKTWGVSFILRQSRLFEWSLGGLHPMKRGGTEVCTVKRERILQMKGLIACITLLLLAGPVADAMAGAAAFQRSKARARKNATLFRQQTADYWNRHDAALSLNGSATVETSDHPAQGTERRATGRSGSPANK